MEQEQESCLQDHAMGELALPLPEQNLEEWALHLDRTAELTLGWQSMVAVLGLKLSSAMGRQCMHRRPWSPHSSSLGKEELCGQGLVSLKREFPGSVCGRAELRPWLESLRRTRV